MRKSWWAAMLYGDESELDTNNTKNVTMIDDERLVRVRATGYDERSNDLFVRIAETANAVANVVFFPGDVQDVHAAMSSGSYADFATYSYENTATFLSDTFGEDVNVWIVRPSRFQYSAYACFENFVMTNKFGAATSYPSSGTAVRHLAFLMDSAKSTLEQERVDISTDLPIHLVGFSKGGIVLNQIATEAARITATPDSNNNNDLDDSTAIERRFFALLSSMHWLDSGNGSLHGAVPTSDETLTALAELRSLKLRVHTTPYQYDAPERPWVKQEVDHFVGAMRHHDSTRMQHIRYHEHEPTSLHMHFQILRDIQLPVPGCTKTGASLSPEVTVEPFHIQTFV